METFCNSDYKDLGSIMIKIMCIGEGGILPYQSCPFDDTSFESE